MVPERMAGADPVALEVSRKVYPHSPRYKLAFHGLQLNTESAY